jgi:hypothetical protein
VVAVRVEGAGLVIGRPEGTHVNIVTRSSKGRDTSGGIR